MSGASGGESAALAEKWAEDFAGVMEAMGDLRPEMRVSPGAPELGADVLWWMQPLDACPGAAIWAGADRETWTAMGNAVLVAAGVESSADDEIRGTWLEVLKQSLGALARHIGSKVGREVACTAGAEQGPPAGRETLLQVSAGVPGRTLHPIALGFSSELLAALETVVEEAPAEAEAAPKAPAAAPAAGDEPSDLPAGALQKLGLLLDVDMPVSVSFGSTHVRLRDVMKLITGSIIELDRSISEPVEVIVNNCVIARGEVVVVDGNYGVRINEVMSRRERIQQSRKFLLPVGGRQSGRSAF